MGKRAALGADENVLKQRKLWKGTLVAYNRLNRMKHVQGTRKESIQKYTTRHWKSTSRDYSGLTELTGKEDVAEAECKD